MNDEQRIVQHKYDEDCPYCYVGMPKQDMQSLLQTNKALEARIDQMCKELAEYKHRALIGKEHLVSRGLLEAIDKALAIGKNK